MDTGPVEPSRVSLRLAAAYAPVVAPSVAGSVSGKDAQRRADRTTDRVEIASARVGPRPARLDGLIAGKVAPGIDFDVVESGRTRDEGGPIQLYRHPADKNAAATGVQAGHRLDVSG